MNALLKDPRRRNLALLALAALISVALAFFALWAEQQEVAPKETPQSFFPGLAGHIREIARIHVVSKNGAFDIVLKPYKGWVIPARNDYPASYQRLKETIVGFAALMTVEPKTARPDWLPLVDLGAPPKGNGVEIELRDGDGHDLAALIAGKSVDIGDPNGYVGLFVRKPNSSQSWLVKSPVEFKGDPADWIEKDIMEVDRARIAEADVDPASGESWEARRDKPSDADFAVSELPKGRELSDPGAADNVATAIANFTFDDARPARDFDFGNAARLITKTFDGLTVTVQTLKQGNDYWATVSAESAPNKLLAAGEARNINAHTDGWAYKLPEAEGQLFMTTLDSLLKPIAAKTPARP
ncbi:MAG TPA: DUF4340 domain-containing protein [Rhizomicrobium sp.]|nr:DUF4340 domain-containing protein [Rhizomicrobium sp.]